MWNKTVHTQALSKSAIQIRVVAVGLEAGEGEIEGK